MKIVLKLPQKLNSICSLQGGLAFKFILIIFATPIFGAIFKINPFHIPIFILFSYVCLKSACNATVKIPKGMQIYLLIFILLLILQVMTGRGFGILAAGGYVLVGTLLLFNILILNPPSTTTIIRWVSLLYQILLLSIFLEYVLIFLGYQEILVVILNNPTSSGYKNYNPSDLLHSIGLITNYGGANSPLLGSQIAGMLSLLSTIWFTLLNANDRMQYVVPNKFYWMLFSCLILSITVNGTVAFMMLLGIGVYVLFIYKSRNKLLLLALALLLLLSTMLLVAKGFLFNRIFNGDPVIFPQNLIADFMLYGVYQELIDITTLEYYFWTFFRPVQLWLDVPLTDQLLGVGANFFLDDNIYISGDFGFGTDVLLKSGLLWSTTFLLFCTQTTIRAYKWSKLFLTNQIIKGDLSKIFAFSAILWTASLIHYLPAIQNSAGYVIFALQFSLIFFLTCQKETSPSSDDGKAS